MEIAVGRFEFKACWALRLALRAQNVEINLLFFTLMKQISPISSIYLISWISVLAAVVPGVVGIIEGERVEFAGSLSLLVVGIVGNFVHEVLFSIQVRLARLEAMADEKEC